MSKNDMSYIKDISHFEINPNETHLETLDRFTKILEKHDLEKNGVRWNMALESLKNHQYAYLLKDYTEEKLNENNG